MSVTSSNGSLRVGDIVNVPGNMFGTIKFIGNVDGKKGTFAGVQLAAEYASRGKNSGDVDGKSYFKTSMPGSGIFLPIEKAEKRASTGSITSSVKSSGLRMASATSPTTPGRLSNFNQGGRTPGTTGLQKPSFSQSVGPGSISARNASPTTFKPPRESLPRPGSPKRPSSPLRKMSNVSAVQTPAAGRLQTPKTRPSIGLARSTMGTPGRAKSPGTRAPSTANGGNKFSQSLRQSTTRTPSRANEPKSSAPSVSSPLGPDDRFDEDDTILEENEAETTPTPVLGKNSDRHELDNRKLREQLAQRDRQLQDQSSAIAEMEQSLVDLQNMMPMAQAMRPPPIPEDEEDLPRDVQSLRAALRDRNERMKMQMEEFDGNRADFRSTIDALEMASSETERVYEARVEDLLEQVRQLQERNQDVEGVALQLRQLEELVQELEDDLQNSRRAEAEARAEVEFLRGEVERGKSELRREKQRHATETALEGGNGAGPNFNEDFEEMQASLEQKDTEIRGLKALIQGLQAVDKSPKRDFSRDSKDSKMNGNSWGHAKQLSTISIGEGADPALVQQIRELESLLNQKTSKEEELQQEVHQLRKSTGLGKWAMPGQFSTAGNVGLGVGLGRPRSDTKILKHASSGSQSTVTGQQTPEASRRKGTGSSGLSDLNESLQRNLNKDDTDQDEAIERKRREAEIKHKKSTSDSSRTDNSSQWCEICEEPGHDILNCANMMGGSNKTPVKSKKDSRGSNSNGTEKPTPLRKTSTHSSITSPLHSGPPQPPPSGPLPAPPSGIMSPKPLPATPGTKPTLIHGTGDQMGMLGGKASGVIDPDKWCALCEKDGHDSVDCPIEDAF